MIYLPINLNMYVGAQKNRLGETVLFSTHNNVWVGRGQTFHAFCIDVND